MAAQVPRAAGSEQRTITAFEPMMSGVWEMLNSEAPPSLQLYYEYDRDTSIDQRSSSASLLYGCRPDSHIIINQRLVMFGEYKVI